MFNNEYPDLRAFEKADVKKKNSPIKIVLVSLLLLVCSPFLIIKYLIDKLKNKKNDTAIT